MTASGASRTIPLSSRTSASRPTKAALAKAGLTTEFMPIPLTVFVLKIGDRSIMIDAGSGVGQWQANATHLPANMAAAGIDRKDIGTILISHFHPDHVWGLMEKGTNAAVFPDAELVVNGAEYRFWTEPGRVEKLPDGRKGAGKRIADVFPTWSNWRLVDERRGGRARRAYRGGAWPHARPFGLHRHVRARTS